MNDCIAYGYNTKNMIHQIFIAIVLGKQNIKDTSGATRHSDQG